jgi:hypothetical protein
MEIGHKILLHNEPFPQNMREGDAPDKFVLVEVVETKKFPGMWGNEQYNGYRALGEDGRYYLLNWSSFPDDSMTPHWSWQRELPENLPRPEITKIIKENDYEWYDVTQGMGHIPFEPVWIPKYKDSISYCAVHQRLFSNTHKCFYCEYHLTGGIPPKDYSWNGWK